MDRVETRKTVEILRSIDVERYGLDMDEQIAAAAVKAYLCGFPRQEALGMLRAAMKGTVLKIPALHRKPELLRTTVKGPEFVKLIDTAVAVQMDVIEKQKAEQGSDIRNAAICVLRSLGGKCIVENVSPEFLCFLMDCYGELKF